MYLMAKIAIVTVRKSPVIDIYIALVKRKLMWIMLNEKIVSVFRDKNPFFTKYGPLGLLIYRSRINESDFMDDQ